MLRKSGHVTSIDLQLLPKSQLILIPLVMWFALGKIFLNWISPSNYSVQKVAEYFASEEMHMYFMLLDYVLPSLNEFNTAFQANESRIGNLLTDMKRLLRKFLGKFVQTKVIKGSDDLRSVSYNNRDNQHPDNNIAVGSRTREFIAEQHDEIDPQLEANFYKSVRTFYEAIVEKMLSKFPWDDTALQDLAVLNPAESVRSSVTAESVIRMGKRFNLITGDDVDKLEEEVIDYTLAPQEDLPPFSSEMRIDHYWHEISMSTSGTRPRFPLLSKVVKALLTIPNSNAETERLFSMIRKIQTDFRSELALDTLCSLLSVKVNSDVDCYNYEPSTEVLRLAKTATMDYVKEHM